MAFSLYSQERSEIKQKLLFLCSIIDVFTNPSGGILNSCLISTKLYRCYFFTPMFHIFVKQRAQIISREAHHPNIYINTNKTFGLNGGETMPLLLWFQKKWYNSKGRRGSCTLLILFHIKWNICKGRWILIELISERPFIAET